MVIVQLINKEHFSIRSIDNVEFGEFLYDQIEALLNMFGQKVEHCNRRADILYFSLYESRQKSTHYEVSDEFGKLLLTHFKHNLQKAIEKYGKAKVKEGNNILFALNSGAISMNDFNKEINS